MSNGYGKFPARIDGGRFPPASDLDWIRIMVQGARMSDGRPVRHEHNGMVIPVDNSFDTSLFMFGVAARVAGAPRRLRFNGGLVQLANNNIWIEPGEIEFAGSLAEPHIAYLEGTVSGGSMVSATAAKAAWIGHDETYWRMPLVLGYLAAGVATVVKPGGIMHMGIVDLKSWYPGRL